MWEGPNSLGIYCACKFDRDLAIFYPGDTVTGKVRFQTIGRPPITGLQARIIGCETVSFGTDFRNSSIAYFVDECYSPLTRGTGAESDDYWYTFSFTLPPKLFPSFSGSYGSIRYYVEPVVSGRQVVPGQTLDERDQFFADAYGAGFVVEPVLDLRLYPELSGPLFLVGDNSGGIRALFSRNKNPIRFTLTLHKKGFKTLEHIHFTVDINNGSSKQITATSLKLIQETKFCLFSTKRVTTQTVTKIVGGAIPPKSTTCWEDTLQVPAAIPITILATNISVCYKLKVTLVTSGFMENVKGEVWIVLGTIGIDDFDFMQRNAQARSNSFTSSRNSLQPRIRHNRPSPNEAPFRSTSLDHRRSIFSLPSYVSIERDDTNDLELPPPTYLEATQGINTPQDFSNP